MESIKRGTGLMGVLGLAMFAACVMPPSSSSPDIGVAQVAIVQAPSNVKCIVITVTTATNMVQRQIGVSSGTSTLEMLTGLPLGSDVFTAVAYNMTCSSVTATSVATFFSAPVTAVVTSSPVSVTLTMQPAGGANVSVDFACPAGKADCDGNVANGCEVTITTDKNNCGACGNVCSLNHATATCTAGACAVSACSAGFANCDGNAANGCEVATTSDANNCGGCGVVCSLAHANPVCTAGACAVGSCVAGFGNCDGNAANGCETAVSSDKNNCGACGLVCSGANGTETCAGGVCSVATCNAGFANCDGNAGNGCETATATDKNNCGMCGNVCSATNGTPSCNGSMCSTTCNAGFGNCDGNAATGCETNLNTDKNNCGACGNVCFVANGTAACAGGTCQVASCNAGFANCDGNPATGCETVLANDRNNCGACGNVCSSANGTPSCSGGVCSVACNAGFADCDGNPGNGCETHVLTDPSNCGICHLVCSSANGMPSCSGGMCAIACGAGFGNCDGNAGNGCESTLANDTNNCGACGNPCSMAHGQSTCNGGVCQVTSCNVGFANCNGTVNDGCETSTSNDTSNCGACGTVCAVGQSCVNGHCQ